MDVSMSSISSAPMKREVKASVFTDLFGKKRYACRLYNDLHPGANVTEDEVEVVTLQNVLTTGQYNDLGFTVGDKVLVLAEAQSTWSTNIVLRSVFYVAETLKNWVRGRRLDLYGSKAVLVPEPELYMVYTGSRKKVDSELLLSACSYPEGASGHYLEARVKVIRDNAPGILGEYVQFAQRADQNIRECRNNGAEAALRTVRECIKDGILVDYLSEHEEEVLDIMFTLYDVEEVQRIHLESELREARKIAIAEGLAEGRAEGRAQGHAEGHAEGRAQGHAEGHAEGRAEGRAEGMSEGIVEGTVRTCRQLGCDMEKAVDLVAATLGIPNEDARERVRSIW